MTANDRRGKDAKLLIRIRNSSPRVTEAMASTMKALLAKGMLQHDVAALFGVNQGRVSEIANGKRFGEAKPVPPDQLEFRFDR